MALKKTIAIIASTEQKASAVVNWLCLENYRFLFLSKPENQFNELTTAMQSKHPGIELDIIDCMKDGCWEADIIILDIPHDEEREVAELIKEVATQKIVVSFSESINAFENDELENLLKYSKVVKAFNTIGSQGISLYGKDEDVVLEVSDMLKNSKQSEVTV